MNYISHDALCVCSLCLCVRCHGGSLALACTCERNMAYSPTRVFLSLGDGHVEGSGSGSKPGVKADCPRCRGAVRQVEVTGSAEVSVGPDRASVIVTVTHSKENVTDCSNSVTRRLDYILQTLRQHSLTVS